MKKELNICVLYAETDNKSNQEEKGWVSNFVKFFTMMLKHTISSVHINVQMLADSDQEQPLPQAYLIPVLSPDFILSDVCLERLDTHLKTSSAKVFNVFKVPLQTVDVPKGIRNRIAYDLFSTEPDNYGAELHNFFTKEAEGSFWMKMIDLCFDIYESHVQPTQEISESNNQSKKAVYLANTSQDLLGARNIIKRELTRHGFEIFPKEQYFTHYADWRRSIEEELSQCQFSIHLLGNSYGPALSGSEQSLLDLENELAAEQSSKNPGFSRLVWINPNMRKVGDKQKAFIHNIKRDAKSSAGAEILQTSLEDFKNTLWEEILEKDFSKTSVSEQGEKNRKKPHIYLIYDSKDIHHATELKKELYNQNVEVLEMPYQGDLIELRNKHVANLKQMDGAIVLQAAVNDQWVHMKLLDLLKAPGFGRSHPVLGRLMLSSATPESRELFENRYQVRTTDLLNKKGIDEFVKSINKSFRKNNEAYQEQS